MSRAAVRIDGSGHELALVGGKGAALDRLVAGRLPVPASVAVTTAAYAEFARQPSIRALVGRIRGGAVVGDDRVDGAFCSADIAPSTRTQLLELIRSIGPTVALRSSATVEDLGSSSFAGQYRSILDVDAADDEAVLRGIRLVWASLWHRAPRAYRLALGVDDHDAAMAVVAMHMVAARRAGVVFTVDPGRTVGAARVEAVEGLGESLVAGTETPTAWVVARDTAAREPLPPDVEEALDLALRIEERSGCPQDVEWAADDTVWIVQARPITTIDDPDDDGFDTPVDDAELTTAGIGEMVPGALPPLVWETNRFLLEEALRRTLGDLDALPERDEDRPLIRRVRGRVALDFDRLREAAELLPGGGVDELEAQYFGSSPSPSSTMSSRHAGGLRALVHDLRVMILRRQAVEDAEITVEAARRLDDALDDRRCSDRELLRRRNRLVDLAARGLAAELAVAASAGAAHHRVELLLAPHLGEQEAARRARDVVHTDVDRIVDAGDSMAVIAGPTWAERGLDAPEVPRPAPEVAAARRAALEALLRARPGWRTRRIITGQVVDVRIHVLRRVIADAGSLLGLREQTKAALLSVGGAIRRIDVELGRRLAAARLLASADDVELLGVAELTEAILEAEVPGGLAARRRAGRRCADAAPLPVRFRGRPRPATPVTGPVAAELTGWGASAGTATGRARVLHTSDDGLEPGEVLVARSTDASWSPRFVDAGAVVVEVGGPLSHAAILARELGVPAVLNVAGAIDQLDGRTVTVDGDLGRIVVHEHEVVQP
ncbi:MAG: PEP/pyruvate-binding domain-containing protein [Actinomycetota bacterium]